MTRHTYRAEKLRNAAVFLMSVKQVIDLDLNQQNNDCGQPLGQFTIAGLINGIHLVAGILDQMADELDEVQP